MATIFGKSQRSIQRELARGMVEHLKSDLTTHFVYSEEFAQRKTDYEKTAKGVPLKLGSDIILIKAIVALLILWLIGGAIIKNSFSPDAVVMYFNRKGWPTGTRFSTKTLYSYIYLGLIEDISKKNLLYQGKGYKPRSKPPKHSRVGTAVRSISKRSELANNRLEYGHWEIDTVRSAKNTSLECLLTLTERMTRFEIII